MDDQYKYYSLHESNGIFYPFKARPYDDANYFYALSRDSGNTWVIAFDGKRHTTITGDWKKAVDLLEKLNKDIKPRICHN